MSEEQSLKSEKKSESEASVPGEKTEERGRRERGREGVLLSLHNLSSVGSSAAYTEKNLYDEEARAAGMQTAAICISYSIIITIIKL